jgi:hypothetical protein
MIINYNKEAVYLLWGTSSYSTVIYVNLRLQIVK